MFNLPKKIKVVDVSARDGLQSFPRWVDTDIKIRMVDRLSEVGFPVIEVTNFAHPRVIPHLKDAEEVMRSIKRRPGIVYRAQAQEILGLITCSEIYNQKNQNMTIDRGIDAAIETFEVSRRAAIPFVMAVGMAW